VRTAGVEIDADAIADARRRLARKLGRFARRIERLTLRYEDVSPRGGAEIICRVKVVLTGLRSVVFEARGPDDRTASILAFDGVARAVKKALVRARSHERAMRASKGRKPPAPRVKSGTRARKRKPAPHPEGRSLIGRRVGRAPENLERVLESAEQVDTSAPRRSATDRRAGGGSTARRNVKRNVSGMSATLEDSARDRPTRKSTRKGSQGSMSDTGLRLRQTRATAAPSARARRNKAARASVGAST
jgi:hypothetical protein